jgi:hypothetical protein
MTMVSYVTFAVFREKFLIFESSPMMGVRYARHMECNFNFL